MKFLFVLFASFASFISNAATNPTDINPAALESFKNNFKQAREVDWSASGDLYKVKFAIDNQYVSAYYNLEGELIGITRNISTSSLPVMLQSELKKELDGFWISNLFEVSGEAGTSYYATLENADGTRVLQSNNSKSWSTYSKTRKA